jgi:hypothetical protein
MLKSKCTHEGCPELLFHGDIEKHEETCLYNEIVCGDCNLKFKLKNEKKFKGVFPYSHDCIPALKKALLKQEH